MIIKEQTLTYSSAYECKIVKTPFKNRLIILGTTVEHSLTSSLLNVVDIRLSLTSYSYELLVSILKQRVKFLGWTIRSDEVLKFITNESDGSIGKAMDLLQMAYRIMRSDSKDILDMEHVSTAAVLTVSS